jgi:pSer/pThr/pTyr-binding forkhead associated (FHA) protein
VFPEGDQWLVEDMGSTNGTFLDDQKVTGPAPVRPGAQIRIGQSVLELRG